MPPPAPVTPVVLRGIITAAGCSQVDEDRFNWFFTTPDGKRIIVIPKQGDLVSLEIMMEILDPLPMNDGEFVKHHEAVLRRLG